MDVGKVPEYLSLPSRYFVHIGGSSFQYLLWISIFFPYNKTEINTISMPIKKTGCKLKPNNGTAATAAHIVATAHANPSNKKRTPN